MNKAKPTMSQLIKTRFMVKLHVAVGTVYLSWKTLTHRGEVTEQEQIKNVCDHDNDRHNEAFIKN